MDSVLAERGNRIRVVWKSLCHINLEIRNPQENIDSGIFKCQVEGQKGEKSSRNMIVYNPNTPFTFELVPQSFSVYRVSMV